MSHLMDILLADRDRADMFSAPGITQCREVAAAMEAQARVLSDVDTYTDWLAAHCMRAPKEHTRVGYIPQGLTNLQRFIDSLDVPQLVAMQLHPDRMVQGEASERLAQRYLEDPQTQAYIAKVAAEVMVEES